MVIPPTNKVKLAASIHQLQTSSWQVHVEPEQCCDKVKQYNSDKPDFTRQPFRRMNHLQAGCKRLLISVPKIKRMALVAKAQVIIGGAVIHEESNAQTIALFVLVRI